MGQVTDSSGPIGFGLIEREEQFSFPQKADGGKAVQPQATTGHQSPRIS